MNLLFDYLEYGTKDRKIINTQRIFFFCASIHIDGNERLYKPALCRNEFLIYESQISKAFNDCMHKTYDYKAGK